MDTRIHLKECASLATRFGEVCLFVGDGKGDATDPPTTVRIQDVGIAGAGGRLGRMLRQPLRMFAKVHRERPSVVHFHDPELIPVGVLLKVLGYRVIYDVHEDVPRQILMKHWIPGMLRRPVAASIGALEHMATKAFDAIIVATPKIAKRFPVSKTIVVHNYPIASELVVNCSVHQIDRPRSFAYVGAISAARGAKEMLAAFDYLQDVPGIKLEMAGDFAPTSLLEELRQSPSCSFVRYHGVVRRQRVAEILSSVRAGLVIFHPTRAHVDALPNKMFEYLSAGLPVIASHFPLWRQIIDTAGCGLLVDPLRPDEVAKAMRWILDNPSKAEAMGRRGREAVEKLYNWDAEAAKLVSLYSSLLEGAAKDNR